MPFSEPEVQEGDSRLWAEVDSVEGEARMWRFAGRHRFVDVTDEYVPREVAERLADALEGIDNTKACPHPEDPSLAYAITAAMEAFAEFRAAFPKSKET